MANTAFPASPTVGDRHRVDPSGPLREWTGNSWKLVEHGVLRQNATGNVSVNVTGRDAVQLTLTGNVSKVTWTGWRNDSTVMQEVRVVVQQDGTGGRTFSWPDVQGIWLESPADVADLSKTKNDVVLEFRAMTIDGGTTVKLEPIGVEYTMPCLFAVCDEVDVPAVAAGGSVTIGHAFSTVGSVELVDQATGRRVVADWWQQTALPGGPIRIDFAAAHVAGTYKARVVGQQLSPCQMVAVAEQWETLDFSSVNAASLKATIQWTGDPGDVEWQWGDGSIDNPSNNVEITHAYSPNYTGTVRLRWRKGTPILKIDLRAVAAWRLNAATGQLPRDLQNLSVSLTGSAIIGDVADLPRALSLLSASTNGSATAIVGNAADLPRGLAHINLANQSGSSIGGSFASLPTGLTYLALPSTGSTIFGPADDLPTPLTTLLLQQSNSFVSGNAADLPAGLTNLHLFATASTISGDAANYPAGLTYLALGGTSATVRWATAGSMQNITNRLDVAVGAGGSGLTAAEVNRALVDLVNANRTPTGEKLLRFTGAANAAPDTTSGGLDGVAAIATLVGRGWIVNTN